MRSVSLLCLLCGLTGAQAPLQVSAGAPPAGFDPHRTTDPGSFLFWAQVYETPVEIGLDPGGHLELRRAVCTPPLISEDELTLTLRVLAGSRFHDDACFPEGKGRVAGPRDVRDMFLRHADPRTRSPWWEPFLAGRIVGLDAWRRRARKHGFGDYDAEVAGVRVEGDRVVLRLVQVYPQLPGLLSQPWASLVPREAVRRYGNLDEHPVGSGPFRFAGRDELDTFRFLPASGGGDGSPGVEELRISVIPEVERRLRRFESGALHVLPLVPSIAGDFVDSAGRLRRKWRKRDVRIREAPPLAVSYVVFNTQHEVLGKPAVRRALTLAVDRKAFVDRAYGPRALLADSPVPPVFPEAAAVAARPYELAEQDVERARSLLAGAGHPDGRDVPLLVLDVPGLQPGSPGERAARGLLADLEALGIEGQLRAEPFAVWQQRVHAGDLHMAWVSWFADYPDAENFLGLFNGSPDPGDNPFNYGRYADPEFDKLYSRIARTYAGARRSHLVARAVDILRRDAPWIFLAFPRPLHAVQPEVMGFRPNLLNQSLAGVRLMEEDG